jgi:ATP-binding cassette subfamily B multidrug efflux pump
LTFNHIIPWATLPTIFAYAFLVYLGVPRVLENQLSAGDLVAMFSFVMLMQMPLFELGPLIAEWQRGKVSMHRLNKVISLRTPAEFNEKNSVALAAKSMPSIVADELVLRTDPNQRVLNFKILPGEKFGIIGPVGSGKSTLLETIAGIN